MKKLFVFMGVLLLGILVYSLKNKEVTENQLVDINKSNKVKNEKIVKKIVNSDNNVSLHINEKKRTIEKEKTIEKTIEETKVENSEELVMEQEEIEEMLDQEKYMQKLFEPKSEELTPEYIEKMIEEQESMMEEYDG